MEQKQEHACPRCYQLLRIAAEPARSARSVLLACPEPYCDYVLVLPRREVERTPRWSWPKLFRPVRAAS